MPESEFAIENPVVLPAKRPSTPWGYTLWLITKGLRMDGRQLGHEAKMDYYAEVMTGRDPVATHIGGVAFRAELERQQAAQRPPRRDRRRRGASAE